MTGLCWSQAHSAQEGDGIRVIDEALSEDLQHPVGRLAALEPQAPPDGLVEGLSAAAPGAGADAPDKADCVEDGHMMSDIALVDAQVAGEGTDCGRGPQCERDPVPCRVSEGLPLFSLRLVDGGTGVILWGMRGRLTESAKRTAHSVKP